MSDNAINTIYRIIFPYILIFPNQQIVHLLSSSARPTRPTSTLTDTRLSGLISQHALLPAKRRLGIVLLNTQSIAHAVALATTHPTFLCLVNSYSILQEEGSGITFWKERISQSSGQRTCSWAQLLPQPRSLALNPLMMNLYASALTTRFLSSSRTETTSY